MTQVLPADPIRMERNPYYWQVDEPGQPAPVHRRGRARLLRERRGPQALDRPGQDRLPEPDGGRRLVHVLQGEREQGRLPGPALAVGQHRDLLPEPERTGPGPGQAVRQRPSSARRSTSRSTARRSPRSSTTASYKPRQYSPVSGSPEYDAGAWRRSGPSSTRRRRTTCWTGSA